MNEFDFAEKYLIQFKIKGNEIIPKYCPVCSGGRHRDKDTFGLNFEKHTYKCLRGSCGSQGTFSQLCEIYNERADYIVEIRKQYFESANKIKKEYKKPTMKLNDIGQQAHSYINLRKISDNTIRAFGIKSDEKGNIVFPFYDEKGGHTTNKIRIPRKFIKGTDKTKIWQETGGKPILWNMQNIDRNKPIVITEGEWDCLSVYEAGFHNVVSIPFGTENMEWINECWEWLEGCKEFILWFDDDEAGKRAINEVTRKLGTYRCKVISNNLQCKDANEILFKYGTEKISEIINKSDFIPIEHLEKLSECKKVKTERMLFGLRDLDYELGGCRMGELTIWTGKRGGGKSTVLSQTIPEAVEQGYKVFIYSGELSNSKVKEWLDRQIAGEKHIITQVDELTQREEYNVNSYVERKISKWYDEFVYTYGDNGENNENCLFEIMEYAYRRHNIKRFILDNLKTIKFNDEANFYRAQGLFVSRAKAFCRKYNVHIDLVVHPRKTNNDSLADEDVGGSVDIIDLADNIVSISRLTRKMYENADSNIKTLMRHKDHPNGEYDEYVRNTIIEVKKNREYGDTGRKLYYFFNSKSKRIYKNFNRTTFEFLKNIIVPTEEIKTTSQECPF